MDDVAQAFLPVNFAISFSILTDRNACAAINGFA